MTSARLRRLAHAVARASVEGKTLSVIGLLDDLPLADDDPASIKSALPQGPAQGVTQRNQHLAQHSADGVGARIQRQQRREGAA
jgi:hypothetical protein